ncbi:ikaros family zinc finger protein-like isoform X3 [Cololabis saira]|uniref:ikaros family zinc finger protein-like isoform X3 n=1 Tax=Cololabis saira TaxID=129043 RepID=UPI002AD46964|nr:ikaros family zinc finger protein-like isoform X3 [Cololabis saira]
MDVDDCNGRSYTSGGGDSLMEREFSGALGGPTVSTPNSKENSPSRSLSANSIKVELYSDEDPGRSTEDERGERIDEADPEQGMEMGGGYKEFTNPEIMPTGAIRLPNGKLKCDICGMICIGPNVLMVHKRSHTGERPFQCDQCGASFTQKGNLLRHIKLHSGEKPFKCPFCSYACRRRDALTGHLRTHAGQKHIRLSLADVPYELNADLDKEGDMHPEDLEVPDFTGLRREYAGGAGNGGGGVADTLRPLHIPNTHRPCLPEPRLTQSSTHSSVVLGPRLNCIGAGAGVGPVGLGGREGAEGHEDLPAVQSDAPSPSNGCQDSTDTESMPDELCNSTIAHPPILHSNNGHHLLHSTNHVSRPLPTSHHRNRERHSPSNAKDRDMKREDGGHLPPPAPVPSSPTAPSSTSREALRVVDAEGRPVRSFRCEHCRVLFLDHVMFTIHMGCHGFRQPFECNICGHRSQDRYEFSSHIVRGEHIFD